MLNNKNIIKVENLTISYGENVILSDINFEIKKTINIKIFLKIKKKLAME